MSLDPVLFTPVTLREMHSRNRIMVSPMCMYSSDDGGCATDYHLVNVGRFALGGAGIVMVEATAITRRGRISNRDLGLWEDAQIDPLRRIADFIGEYDAVPAIQLGHAGRRAGSPAPWDEIYPPPDNGPAVWPGIAPSAVASGAGRPVPEAMSVTDIEENIEAWASAAHRAAAAGFKLVELHGAHGYLLHSFLSPLANQRTDEYGGSAENRMRFPLRVVDAVREALGPDIAFSYRVSSVDGVPEGLQIEDTEVFVRELMAHGVDVIDCSSGGIRTDRKIDSRVRRGYGFHAPYARRIKENTGATVATVGLVVEPQQAEAMLRAGEADIVVLGRELLVDPNWPVNAEIAMTSHSHLARHRQVGSYLDLRESQLAVLREQGEHPMSRYEN